jgi:hypothetical protein
MSGARAPRGRMNHVICGWPQEGAGGGWDGGVPVLPLEFRWTAHRRTAYQTPSAASSCNSPVHRLSIFRVLAVTALADSLASLRVGVFSNCFRRIIPSYHTLSFALPRTSAGHIQLTLGSYPCLSYLARTMSERFHVKSAALNILTVAKYNRLSFEAGARHSA